jgi:hypothetical protein
VGEEEERRRKRVIKATPYVLYSHERTTVTEFAW